MWAFILSTFDKTQTGDLADALKALGHPSRLEIMRQLALRNRCCGGDFCDCLPLAQSTISQHLDMLKSVGLVDWQQEGTRSIYTLNRARLAELARSLEGMAAMNSLNVCATPENESSNS